jgi:predicted RNA-binding protein with PUA-like domain
MAYWLFKSEPNTWGWDDQVAKGDAGEEWDGHSVNEKQIVGVVEVCAEAHPDSTTDDPRWECVDVKAVAPFPRPVTLAEVKAEPRLSELALVRQSRLSVVPVNEAEWRLICEMGGYQG